MTPRAYRSAPGVYRCDAESRVTLLPLDLPRPDQHSKTHSSQLPNRRAAASFLRLGPKRPGSTTTPRSTIFTGPLPIKLCRYSAGVVFSVPQLWRPRLGTRRLRRKADESPQRSGVVDCTGRDGPPDPA